MRRTATRFSTAAATALLLTHVAAAAANDTTGQSWKDPALGEILRTADLVAEVKVFVGGQHSAWVDVIRTFRGSAKGTIRIEGFNSYEWNTAYHTMREDERYIIALYRVGDSYCPATPSSARFPLNGSKVIGRFGRGEFLVEIPGDDFREALRSFYAGDPAKAAESLGRLMGTGSIETRYLSIVLLGELASHAPAAVDTALRFLAPLSTDGNPAMREAAAQSLGQIGGHKSTKALARFVEDKDRSVARSAALAVCETGSHGAGAELVAWLEKSAAYTDASRRKPSTEALQAQATVLQFLAEGDWVHRVDYAERHAVIRGMLEVVASGRPSRARIAAHVLGRMGATEAIEPLSRLLDAEDYALRQEASTALTMITLTPAAYSRSEFSGWWQEHKDGNRRQWIAEGLRLAQESLAKNSYDGDSLARALLAIAQDPIGPWIVRKKAAEGTGWEDMPIAQIGGPLIAPFVEAQAASRLASRRTRANETMAGLIDRFGTAAKVFVPSILLAASDSDSDVRKAAIEAMAEIDPKHLTRAQLDEVVASLVADIGRKANSLTRDESAGVLRKITGRYHSFYESKSYENSEERGGTERWLRWWRDASRNGWTPLARTAPARAQTDDGRPILLRLSDDDPDVWLAASTQLLSGDRASQKQLAAAAASPSPRLRAVAAALMGLAGRVESSKVLVPLLSDKEAMVRLQAAWAIGNCARASKSVPEALLTLAAKSPPAPVDPWSQPTPDLPPSIAGADPGPTVASRPLGAVQTQATIALGKIGGLEAIQVLLRMGLADSSDIASMATFALSLSPDRLADTAILKILAETGSSTARDLAARAVAARRPDGGAKALAEAVSKLERWDALALINALGLVARPTDAAHIAPFLDPMNEAASVAITYALAREPGPAAIEALLGVLAEGVTTSRYYAILAIEELGRRRQLPGILRLRISAALAARFDDFDMSTSSAVARALEYVGGPEVAEPVMEHLNATIPPDIRGYAAAVKFAGPAGLAFVLEQLKTESWGQRYYSLRALRYSPTTTAIRTLMQHWRDDESPYQEIVEKTLVECGPRALREVALALRSNKPFERRRAALLLGRIPAPEAAAILRRTAASTDADLARAAELALKLRGTRAGTRVPHTTR